MAAPAIPNLNTLRSGRGRGKGRAMAALGEPSTMSNEEGKAKHDKIVQQTDADAAASRLSAVQAGYLVDPYAKLFATSEAQRRLPIINRGTYVRTQAIDQLVNAFLESRPSQKKQIISLGAGTDTRYFRLMSRYRWPPRDPDWIYHELDFQANATRKVRSIMKYSELVGDVRCPVSYGAYPDQSVGPECIVDAPYYHVHPVDLRTLDPSKETPRTFRHIDPSSPTLILSECCLCYLAPAAADTVALYFTKHFFPSTTPLGMIIYEPIKPDDAFGKTMVTNLAARGIVLQGLKKYGSLDAQAERMKAYGFADSRGSDVNELWKKAIDEREKERVAGLEMVDEVEEWELLAGHYCVLWAWRDGEGDSGSENWARWKTLFQ